MARRQTITPISHIVLEETSWSARGMEKRDRPRAPGGKETPHSVPCTAIHVPSLSLEFTPDPLPGRCVPRQAASGRADANGRVNVRKTMEADGLNLAAWR